MFRWIIGSSLQFRFLVVAAAAALLAFGSQQLRKIPGIDVIRSSSGGALSQVVMLFKPGTDLLVARQRVQERLKIAIAELPQSAGMPVMLQPLSSTSRVMKIGLTSKTFDMMDLSMIAYWTIKFRLM